MLDYVWIIPLVSCLSRLVHDVFAELIGSDISAARFLTRIPSPLGAEIDLDIFTLHTIRYITSHISTIAIITLAEYNHRFNHRGPNLGLRPQAHTTHDSQFGSNHMSLSEIIVYLNLLHLTLPGDLSHSLLVGKHPLTCSTPDSAPIIVVTLAVHQHAFFKRFRYSCHLDDPPSLCRRPNLVQALQ